MTKGYLNLVLHAHLPFVRHVDRDDRLEERWLFEAMTECYIPLLQVFHQLVRDQVDFRITISLSPTLLSMLRDCLLQVRYREYLYRSLMLAEHEVERTQGDAKFHALAQAYQTRLQEIKEFYDHYNGDLVTAFAELHRVGCVELITSAATHAFLPYMQTEEAIRAQIATAVTTFESCFGFRPRGIWLPECAYTPRMLTHLQEFSIGYFFVDTHAFTSAHPRPAFGTFSPILVGNSGIAAFARDEESSQQVWSSDRGYPGDYDYREYYRDIGFDLDESYIRPFIHPDGIRIHTGFKYYRITVKTSFKNSRTTSIALVKKRVNMRATSCSIGNASLRICTARWVGYPLSRRHTMQSYLGIGGMRGRFSSMCSCASFTSIKTRLRPSRPPSTLRCIRITLAPISHFLRGGATAMAKSG
ncbi:hypothetical protein GCM10025858_23200 [Alicyclobacillus sacchari]|uniref:hypothetical protein n=1 Tax=Alicyclobacillus sacchari TaxID=392010 RepID=UPI0023E97B9B|nr:hypothetical protein [Alicyclobacillus sacchari]GMA57817.1 hypothetical protein GCM10025858_23200 [Alicyclobacillus sacchari]